jgi:fibro-slime domain-containing protein
VKRIVGSVVFTVGALSLVHCGSPEVSSVDPDDSNPMAGRNGQGGADGNPDLNLGGMQGEAGAGEEGCEGEGGCTTLLPDPACGDGAINVAGEQCDDGNGDSGDGCTANCTLEADFACPTPGQPCVSTVRCGDDKITGGETCDDGNTSAGDGCDAACMLEEGWTCPVPGLRCEAAACGDGKLAGFEECDFETAETGCTNCKIDDDFDCDAQGCEPTVCGDGEVQRGEHCEDGNDPSFDGCYDCRFEPDCQDGVCAAQCGDGQRFDGEACDDGNVRDGDGCSSTCQIEQGYDCSDLIGEPPPTLALPIIYRDFIGEGNSLRDTASCYNPVTEAPTAQKTRPCFHIDFNGLGGNGVDDVVEVDLGDDGRPVYACPGGDCDQNPGHLFINGSDTRPNFNGPESFAEWFDSSSPNVIEVLDALTLHYQAGPGTYVFDATDNFYPLDGKGWVQAGEESLASASCQHNNSFTSETHFWFEYQGGEQFEFKGDDDLWVFVNGKLTLDLGGLHVSQTASFSLDADTDGPGNADTADGTADRVVRGVTTNDFDLGLVPGGVYEIVMFHAERNECGSNFKVTLKDFNKPKSECKSVCGDGIVASDELCDDGPNGNDGAYGNCGPDCKSRGPFCGDGELQANEGEACDDGLNLSTYGDGCAPGCVEPPSCGDGQVQSTFEQCDDGENDGGYGECAERCVLGPRCGDGKVQRDEGETCDDGNRTNGDGCNVSCKREPGVF